MTLAIIIVATEFAASVTVGCNTCSALAVTTCEVTKTKAATTMGGYNKSKGQTNNKRSQQKQKATTTTATTITTKVTTSQRE